MSVPTIQGLRARALQAPLAYPISTASGVIPTAPLVLIDIATDAGVTGQAYIFGYTPLTLKPLVALLDELAPLIHGKSLAPGAVDAALRSRFTLLGTAGLLRMALAGIEMALWDAWAKHLGQPLALVLGGDLRPTRAYDSHSLDGEALALERALRSAGQGFTAIKTKVGYADFATERAVLAALRRELGDGFVIMADYNQSLTVPEALRRTALLADLGIHWFEEPITKDDHAGNALLTGRLGADLQLGENWFGPEEMILSLGAGAGRLAMVDVMKIGGVCGWMKAAALAESYGRPLSSHLFQEISAHLLAVTPTADWLEYLDIAGEVLAGGLEIRDGMAIPSNAPGSGISFDEGRIARLIA